MYVIYNYTKGTSVDNTWYGEFLTAQRKALELSEGAEYESILGICTNPQRSAPEAIYIHGIEYLPKENE